MKNGYIIATASYWHWAAYDKKQWEKNMKEHGNRYYIYETYYEAELDIPDALIDLCHEHLTIIKIYF